MNDDVPFRFADGVAGAPAVSTDRITTVQRPGDVATPGAPSPPIELMRRQQFDPLEIGLRYRVWIGLAILAGLLLGGLAYWKFGPTYDAKAQILVSRKASIHLKSDDLRTYGERSEHVALIMSPMIVRKAVALRRLDRLPSLATKKDPVAAIITELKAKRVAGTDQSFLNIIELTYSNRYAQDAVAVLDAIVAAYSQYLQESQKEHTNELLTLIHTATVDLRKQLEAKQQEYLRFRAEAPFLWRRPTVADESSQDVISVHIDEVQKIQQALSGVTVEQTVVRSKIRALEEAIASGRSPRELTALVKLFLYSEGHKNAAEAFAAPADAPDVVRTQLVPLYLEEQRLLSEFGEDHPDVIAVRQRMEALRRLARRTAADDSLDRLDTGDSSLVDVYLAGLREQDAELTHRRQQLEKLYEEKLRVAKQFAHILEQDQAYRDQIQSIKSTLDVVISRMQEIELIKDNRGYALRTVAEPKAEVSIKRPLKFLGAGLFGSLVAVTAMIYLREVRSRSLRSLEELRNALAVPVLGGIPEFTATEHGPPTARKCAQWYRLYPRSGEAEAFRVVRTRLLVSLHDEHHRVLQITSPEPNDGKTTVACNLALAVAQSGKRVLLLDADLRRPSIHKALGLRQDIGVTDILRGEIDWQTAVQHTVENNLDVLPAGLPVDNPAELLSSHAFRHLLQTLRVEYDLVVVDSAPVLAVTDPCVVASLTDVVLFVVRLNKSRHSSTRRALELMHAHGARILGVVGNCLPDDGEDSELYTAFYAPYCAAGADADTAGEAADPSALAEASEAGRPSEEEAADRSSTPIASGA
ncbi:MAG: polysaccharide biosynthesis tyrosine autokinase [Planctomycetota bacterium]|nr:MAG: polysaccharide biosynthesis tyrosine autokinase [Planctomycetota bacterium]